MTLRIRTFKDVRAPCKDNLQYCYKFSLGAARNLSKGFCGCCILMNYLSQKCTSLRAFVREKVLLTMYSLTPYTFTYVLFPAHPEVLSAKQTELYDTQEIKALQTSSADPPRNNLEYPYSLLQWPLSTAGIRHRAVRFGIVFIYLYTVKSKFRQLRSLFWLHFLFTCPRFLTKIGQIGRPNIRKIIVQFHLLHTTQNHIVFQGQR